MDLRELQGEEFQIEFRTIKAVLFVNIGDHKFSSAI